MAVDWKTEQAMKRIKVWDVDEFIVFFENSKSYVYPSWKMKTRIFEIDEDFLKKVDKKQSDKVQLTAEERYLAFKCNLVYDVQSWVDDPWNTSQYKSVINYRHKPSNAHVRNRIKRMKLRNGYEDLMCFCKWMRAEKREYGEMVAHVSDVVSIGKPQVQCWTFITKPWKWESLRQFIETELKIEGKTESEIAWLLTMESA